MRRMLSSALLIFAAACSGIPSGPAPLEPIPTPTTPTSTGASVIRVIAMPSSVRPGEPVTVYVFTTTDTGGAAPHTRVTLASSAGALEHRELTTDENAAARTTWTGTASGEITATAGAIRATAPVRIIPPDTIPPPPPPQAPPAPPAPAPPAPAVATVTLTASPSTVEVGWTPTFTATPENLAAGETVSFYQWDLDGNGTNEATSTANTRPFTFQAHGIYTARVHMTTSTGRTATGTARVTVTN
jgi:hypothetical protein